MKRPILLPLLLAFTIDPRGASRSMDDPRGASRSMDDPRGASRSMDDPRGASRSMDDPRGASRSMDDPRGASGFAIFASAHAARLDADLPSSTAVTHFRSPMGRVIYLLYQDETVDLRERAERIAQPLGAQVRVRSLHGLSVVRLAHPTRALDVHRLGSRLLIDTTEPNLAVRPGGITIGAGRSDEDVDQALLLKARQIMGSEEAPAEIVTLAQGAAARTLLFAFSTGDDMGVLLNGQRNLPLLTGHPDARLLQRVIEWTRDAMETEFGSPAEPPPPIDEQPASAPWQDAVNAAKKTAVAARARLKSSPKKPTPDKEESP